MKTKGYVLFFALLLITAEMRPQSSDWFSLPDYWKISGKALAANVDTADINRDGFTDIVLGNFNSTYVYYGGKELLDSAVDVTYTGRCLAVCDYNGDGFDDMVVMHFTNFDSTRWDYDGEILFYYGSDTTEILIDTIAEYSIPLPTLYPTYEKIGLGYDGSGIRTGDLNGDGKVDIIINAYEYGYYEVGYYEGCIFVYMGKETPLNKPDYQVNGDSSLSLPFYGSYFDIGNINGDEYDDLLVSSRARTTPPDSKDSVEILHVYYGSDNFSFVKGGESVKYSSRVNYVEKWSDWFRQQFSVNDINSDGYDDVIVGGIGWGSDVDTTSVYSGGINGIDTIPYFMFINPDSTDDDYLAGSGISYNIGDFNGDGYDDFIFPHGMIFILQLGGPEVSRTNTFGARGLLEARLNFPDKAINVGDQNGDGNNDFIILEQSYDETSYGYAIIILGNHLVHTSVQGTENNTYPEQFHLNQNYPNPFNPTTTISWYLPERSNVVLNIYDTLGRKITTLINKDMPAGEHNTEFDAGRYRLSSGVYYYELKINNHHSVKKMMVIK